MRSVLRHVVGLVTLTVASLLVLGLLQWSRHVATDRYEVRLNQFFAPALLQAVTAQRAVDRVLIGLHPGRESWNGAAVVPVDLEMRAMFDAVDESLSEVNRLYLAFDIGNSFRLPERAQRQAEAASEQLLPTIGSDTSLEPADIVGVLAPLRSTLSQLQRVLELDRREDVRSEYRTSVRMTRAALMAGAAMLLVAAPLLWGLSRGLRQAVRNELRSRSDLEEAKQNLESMALYDDLTGLGNRHLFKARLTQIAGNAGRSQKRSVLMYVDVDHFKRINDSLGHDAGDMVLKIIGARICEAVRAGDTVARLGGDEFTLIVSDVPDAAAAAAIASKVLERINEPILVSGHEIVVSASVGVTMMPDDGDDPALLMKNADIALYEAKDLGRGTFHFFVEEMNSAILENARIERELRVALRNDELDLHYQPLVCLSSGSVISMEALLRWRRADGTTVAPVDFIGVAERSGLIVEMGDWVMRRACRDLATLRAGNAPELRMSVNLSPRQFRDTGLRVLVESALADHGLTGEALELEITESTLIEDFDSAVSALRELRELGVTVAIDDFGIGYSSLGYLKRLPLDTIKIDRSFIRDIETDPDDRSIVNAILAMAKSLSLHVVAEGIETEAQRRHLSKQGCDLGQGYLFARPAALGEVRATLASRVDGRARSAAGLRIV